MPVDGVDELFALPPGEFTAARDALAKQLRASGDKEGAAAVKALRRPTLAAWAVNQVAREHRDLVEAVVAAGEQLVVAQERLLGGGGRDELRVATTARRAAVQAATAAAVAVAGPSAREQVHATFDAAATDPDGAAEVRSGRLTKELEPPSSFALLAGLGSPAGDAEEADEPEEIGDLVEADAIPAVDEEALAEARAQLATARDEAQAAATERAELARKLADADERIAAAGQAVAAAEAEVARIAGT